MGTATVDFLKVQPLKWHLGAHPSSSITFLNPLMQEQRREGTGLQVKPNICLHSVFENPTAAANRRRKEEKKWMRMVGGEKALLSDADDKSYGGLFSLWHSSSHHIPLLPPPLLFSLFASTAGDGRLKHSKVSFFLTSPFLSFSRPPAAFLASCHTSSPWLWLTLYGNCLLNCLSPPQWEFDSSIL